MSTTSTTSRRRTLDYELTPKQVEANDLLAGAGTHKMLYGGSRSGKTFLLVRALVLRATKAPKSRHAVLRFRFNHVKSSIVLDTFPKVMSTCFPGLSYKLDRTDWYAVFPNGSELWFGGLDDKERVDKILGQEYATLFLNECSQIGFDSRNTALTRLAQHAVCDNGEVLQLRCYYDENPPSKGHWTYVLFEQHRKPDTGDPLPDASQYASMQVNPDDNLANLPAGYLELLDSLPARHQRRFRRGEFAEANPDALFEQQMIDRFRLIDEAPPDMQRIVVAVDPSGADGESEGHDDIGIVVAGLGTDGRGYLLEDLTINAPPAVWGRIAVTAYDRHQADVIVGEGNYGGAMVESVVKTALAEQELQAAFRLVTASRGKVVRAEPISALYTTGKVRHVGFHVKLEEELAGMSTHGYEGEGSPNRADAAVWAFTELFPGLVSQRKKKTPKKRPPRMQGGQRSWMAA